VGKKKIGVWEILVGVLAFAVLFAACFWIIPFITEITFPMDNWRDFRPLDWKVYRDAADYLIRGKSPYRIPGKLQFYNAPWVLFAILPFLLFPYPYGLALFMSMGFAAFLFIYSRYNKSLLSAMFFLLSAPVVWGLIVGQIDWIVLLGLLLPPQYGLFLVLAKPQVGCLVALIWLIEAYKEKRMVRTFLPVSMAFGLSFLIYGLWALNWIGLVEAEPMLWWPYSLILGIPMSLYALKKSNTQLALCASSMLSPHTLPHSWCGGMLIISHPLVMAVFSVGTWVYTFISVS